MRRGFITLLFVPLLLGSCDWTPERDNPYDPKSGLILSVNRLPEITHLEVTSHCTASPDNDICEAIVVCGAVDRDDPSLDINVYAEAEPVGKMFFDSPSGYYELRVLRDELPIVQPLTFRVEAIDDSGAVVADSVDLARWFDDTYPQLSFPALQSFPRPELIGPDPVVSWLQIPQGEADFLSVSIYLRDVYLRWDTSGIPTTDTTLVLTYPLKDASRYPGYWYSWTLTMHNETGSSSTSLSGFFDYFDSSDTLQVPATPERVKAHGN